MILTAEYTMAEYTTNLVLAYMDECYFVPSSANFQPHPWMFWKSGIPVRTRLGHLHPIEFWGPLPSYDCLWPSLYKNDVYSSRAHPDRTGDAGGMRRVQNTLANSWSHAFLNQDTSQIFEVCGIRMLFFLICLYACLKFLISLFFIIPFIVFKKFGNFIIFDLRFLCRIQRCIDHCISSIC